jgi:hypothetical protein
MGCAALRVVSPWRNLAFCLQKTNVIDRRNGHKRMANLGACPRLTKVNSFY